VDMARAALTNNNMVGGAIASATCGRQLWLSGGTKGPRPGAARDWEQWKRVDGVSSHGAGITVGGCVQHSPQWDELLVAGPAQAHGRAGRWALHQHGHRGPGRLRHAVQRGAKVTGIPATGLANEVVTRLANGPRVSAGTVG
jgi:hypothetical protein